MPIALFCISVFLIFEITTVDKALFRDYNIKQKEGFGCLKFHFMTADI